MSSHPFYGKVIIPEKEQRKIEKLLAPFQHEPVSGDLQKKIYSSLSAAKESGLISIPFSVVMRKDPNDTHRDYIEILLDTKV